MKHTYIDKKSLNSLEDYSIILVSNILTLKTLESIQDRAIDIGILTDEMIDLSKMLIYDLQRLISQYEIQAKKTLELIPDDFNWKSIIKNMQEDEIKKAKKMIKNGGKK